MPHMKKLSEDQKRFFLFKIKKQFRINAKLCSMRLKHKHKKEKNEREKKRNSQVKIIHVPQIRKKEREIVIKAPKLFYLDFEQSRFELISMIDRIKLALDRNEKVKISFDETRKLTPSGTLFFVSKLEELLKQFPGKITCDYPIDDIVEQLFQHIGILKKLGLESRKTISAENVQHWHYLSGVSTDTSEFKVLFAAYAKELKGDVQGGLYDSMTEAVDNSIEHAFNISNNIDKQEKKWWMFSQKLDGKITVVICDLGIGIPNSIWSKPELLDYFKKAYWQRKKKKDAGLIEIAVNSKKTRTNLTHRGKGLPEMLEFVKTNDIGNFLIHSYIGHFHYDAKLKLEISKNFETPIPGTLIQWVIPLKEI